MLEGKVHVPSLNVVQAIITPSTKENLTKLQTKLATFDGGIWQQTALFILFDVFSTMGTAYLADTAA